MADLVTNNQSSIGTDTIVNSTETITVDQYEKNAQTIQAGAVGIVLDYGHVTNPTYFKLVSTTVPLNITMWGNTINNVYSYEVHWEIWAITVTNSSGADDSEIVFLVAN